MKLRTFSQLLLSAFVVLSLASSCVKEGPMGPAGADGEDGADGADGSVTCLDCHSGTNMAQKNAEFVMSEHSVGAIAVEYAGGRASCARCHSHEGFVQFATLGSVAGDITNPSAWKCSTCHGLHSTFEATDYALRMKDPVVPIAAANGVMDMGGNNNLCATCHQSRSAEPGTEKPGETYTLGARTYPHYSAQSNILYGNGFGEIPGSVAYPAKGSSPHFSQASCIGCHMAPFTKEKAFTSTAMVSRGGHSYIPSVSACNACHDGADVTDYNYGGIQSDTHAKLDLLRDKLLALGVITETTVDGEVSYSPKAGVTVPMVQAQAVYNYFGIKYDRSYGVHNPKYVKALLTNTLEALNE